MIGAGSANHSGIKGINQWEPKVMIKRGTATQARVAVVAPDQLR